MFDVGDWIGGRYQLQSLLGKRGGGRQTWLALDRARDSEPLGLGRFLWKSLTRLPPLAPWHPVTTYPSVVLKFLAFNAQMQWDEFKLFERETEILRQQSHPRLPRYRDRFELKPEPGCDWYVFVQDYIAGSSLQALLERGQSFGEDDIYWIAAQVLEILGDLHGNDPPILHRDIKPSNLIWGSDRQIYLIDFGAVQAHVPLVGASLTVVGTSGYTPIEQFWGRSTPASDLYALGATLIHLLTGVAPAHLPQQDLQLQFADRVKVNPRLLRWLRQMTAASSERRFISARQALSALQGELYLGSYPQVAAADDWESPSAVAIASPPKTPIRLLASEETLEIAIPTGKIELMSQVRRGASRLVHRRGIAGLAKVAAMAGMGAIGLGIVTITAGEWLFQSLTPQSLGLGYCILGGLGLTGYGLLRWGDRLLLRLDRQELTLKRAIFKKSYFQIRERREDIIGTFTHQHGDRYQVTLNTEKEVYFLGDRLQPQEAAWLAREIQQWLQS